MKRVLIVAYYFPPLAGIGSIRLSRLAHHLPEFGWEPVVLAPRDTPHPVDPGLSFDEEHVVRSKSIEVSRIGRVLHEGAESKPAAGSEGTGRSARRPRDRQANASFPDRADRVVARGGECRIATACPGASALDAVLSAPVSDHRALRGRTLAEQASRAAVG